MGWLCVMSLAPAVIILTYKIWLPLPAAFLLVKDHLRTADCIAVLDGDSFYRIKRAARLYELGYAKKIIATVTPEPNKKFRDSYYFRNRVLGVGDMTEQEFTLKAFRYFGMEPDAIRFAAAKVTSTYEEALVIKEVLRDEKFRSLILVTSTYHMRRALMIFRHVFKGSGIEIFHSTAVNDRYDPKHWWRRERDVKQVTLEGLSMIQNLLYHILLGKGHTSFDTVR